MLKTPSPNNLLKAEAEQILLADIKVLKKSNKMKQLKKKKILIQKTNKKFINGFFPNFRQQHNDYIEKGWIQDYQNPKGIVDRKGTVSVVWLFR